VCPQALEISRCEAPSFAKRSMAAGIGGDLARSPMRRTTSRQGAPGFFNDFDGCARRRTYRFFSVAFVALRRSALAAAGGFDALAGSADRAAAALARRTPGCSPFVNSIPAASNARTNAATVDACAARFPGLASRRFTVGSDTDENSAEGSDTDQEAAFAVDDTREIKVLLRMVWSPRSFWEPFQTIFFSITVLRRERHQQPKKAKSKQSDSECVHQYAVHFWFPEIASPLNRPTTLVPFTCVCRGRLTHSPAPKSRSPSPIRKAAVNCAGTAATAITAPAAATMFHQ
jgi:hypothetical protein